jgi:cation:H+ antiporter
MAANFEIANLPIPAPIVLIVGIVVLLLGGRLLVDGSVNLARRAGVSTLLVGLTVVAFGTSSPELAFNITAAISGNGALSFGNVVGSNIANIALVLGLASLIRPLVVHGRVVRRELPLLVVTTVGMVVLAWSPPLMATAVGPERGFGRTDGLIMLLGFMLFTWAWFRMARSDKADPLAAEAIAETGEPVQSLPMAIVLTILGLVMLVGGGKLTERGAVGVASWLGMSEALIGLTVVAIATSLPEVVTSIIACRKGHADLAVGNVVGSNLFNILLVLGATCLFGDVPVPMEPELAGLGRGWWDLFVMLGLTMLLVPFTRTNNNHIMKVEGLFLLACYVGYLAFSVIIELGGRSL